MKGSIELARTICEELKGELPDGEQYGSVDVAEILSAHVRNLEDQRDNFEALYLGSGGAQLRFVATSQNENLLTDCEALFQFLDRRGGLGVEVHSKISGVLKRINTTLSAIIEHRLTNDRTAD